MMLKQLVENHPLFVLVPLLAAAAATAWVVSEAVRVEPREFANIQLRDSLAALQTDANLASVAAARATLLEQIVTQSGVQRLTSSNRRRLNTGTSVQRIDSIRIRFDDGFQVRPHIYTVVTEWDVDDGPNNAPTARAQASDRSSAVIELLLPSGTAYRSVTIQWVAFPDTSWIQSERRRWR